MISIDEITGEIVPDRIPNPDGDRDERPRRGDDHLETRLRQMLARQQHRRRRLSDR